MKQSIVIGSRGSDLALWQAHFVQNELKKAGIEASVKIIKTQGDQIQHLGFDKLEGKGFFTKELEECLLNKTIDLAVHSHKDLPTTSPEGLMIGAVSLREDPSELLLISKSSVDNKNKFFMKKGAVLGTSSARRKSQILVFRDDLEIKELRGNVPTRIQKLKDKQYDAILLAAAGIERLNINLDEFHVCKLNPEEFVPAPAQGVLALQIRTDDQDLKKQLRALNNPEVAETIAVERRILNQLDGGCQLPLGVYCIADDDENGDRIFRCWTSFSKSPEDAPRWLYDESKNTDGMADCILEKLRKNTLKSAYITRNSTGSYDLLFKSLQANNIILHSKSLIDIRPVVFKFVPPCDWIFFSSKNAVKHFFNQKPLLGNPKYGCVGKSTAEMLRRYGKKPDFIGYSTDTRMTGKQFAATVGDGSVLFPQARESMRSIQQQFVNSRQVTDLTVYETIKSNDVLIADADVFIFTSPSNVEAFFEKNTIKSGQKIIAMGGATASALRDHGIQRFAQPRTFDDIGIAQAVYNL